MTRLSSVVVVLAICVWPAAVWAVPGDEFWWDGFGSPDIDGPVNCAIEFQGALVVGGRFTLVGGTDVANIARWDGSRWEPLGAGLEGDVMSLAVYGGELVASGRFDRSGSQAVHGIARWNGSSWLALGGGLRLANLSFSPGANALATQSGSLYAAGEFDHAGDVEASQIARWDGAQWSAVSGGLHGGAPMALLPVGSSLFVGGNFDTAGALPAKGVAVWDGAAWSALGAGLSFAYGGPRVNALIEYKGSVVAAGVFDTAGSQPAANVAAWDGQAWRVFADAQSNGIGETASALAVSGDTLLVAGYGLHSWDGALWSVPPPYAAGWVGCLVQTSQGLVAGGRFTGYGPGGGYAAVSLGVIRDGAWTELSTWNDRMHGLGGLGQVDVTALAGYRGDVVATGQFLYAGGPDGRIPLGTVARWDGFTWSRVGTTPSGYGAALLAHGDTLYAGGSFASYPYPARTPVMMYDGANWMALDSLSLSAQSLALYRGVLYAAGRKTDASYPNIGAIYRWDGIHWRKVMEAASIEVIYVFEDRLVAGGNYVTIGGAAAQGLAAFDGAAWSAMDTGLLAAAPRALVACDGALYAGGNFHEAEHGSVGMIRWDGSRWMGIPASTSNLMALACSNHQVFAGGFVADPSGNRGIIAWDGREWSPLGSGTDGPVTSFAELGGQLYVGGLFSRAGGHSSSGIARWDLRGSRNVSSLLSSPTGLPNPFIVSTTVAFQLPRAGHVRVAVFDLRGRRVATLEDRERPVGVGIVTWNGRVDGGRDAPAGVYFIRLDLPGRSETRRVVRLK